MKFGLASLCFHYAVLLSLASLLLHHVTEAVVLSTREELQGNATDVLLVGVLSVDTKIQSRTGNPCVTDYAIKARVIKVNATSIDSSQGDIVTFASFDVDNEAFGCLGLAMGPLPPLQLEPGWCGYVYLQKAPHHSSSSSNMEENHRSHNSHVEELAIAAHGHSFVAAPDSEECKRHSELIHVLALELEEEDDITSPSLIDVDAHEEDEQEVNNNPQSGSCLANDSNLALITMLLAASLGGTASMITLLF